MNAFSCYTIGRDSHKTSIDLKRHLVSALIDTPLISEDLFHTIRTYFNQLDTVSSISQIDNTIYSYVSGRIITNFTPNLSQC